MIAKIEPGADRIAYVRCDAKPQAQLKLMRESHRFIFDAVEMDACFGTRLALQHKNYEMGV